MIQQFVGRHDELSFLERKYTSDQAEFIVIYGRRRIGKTEFIHQFTKDRPHVYFQCEKSNPRILLEEFQERVARAISDETFGKLRLSGWYDLFEELAKRLSVGVGVGGGRHESKGCEPNGKFIIALDEFPYLTETDRAIPSIFQKVWDEILSQSRIMLILCGSSIAMMERDVLSARSPLFGRRTGQVRLQPLKIGEIRLMFPDYAFEDVIRVFGVCDGIPAYLGKFDPGVPFEENIERIVLNRNEYLYAEGEFLLKSEFREYRNYFLILSAIARGKRSFGEITNTSGLDKGLVSKYLSHLQSLHLVGKDHPATTRTNRTRTARYRISDNFLKFWFRFVHGNRHEIEEYGSLRFEDIREHFAQHMGPVFEDVCRSDVRLRFGKEFPVPGAWWNRKGEEIDIVAIDHTSSRAIIGECTWGERRMGASTLQDLFRKRDILVSETGFQPIRYFLYSRNGFTPGLLEAAGGRNDLTLIDIGELERSLTDKP